jgi:hypothetical protein
MKTTKETINGVEHNVVWRNDATELVFQLTTKGCWKKTLPFGYVAELAELNREIVATALPPLPKNPTKDDARLLDLYRAHGLYVYAIENDDSYVDSSYEGIIVGYDKASGADGWIYGDSSREGYIQYITHCVTESGERVEVAIIDREGL